jgi:predicted dehydrogenase
MRFGVVGTSYWAREVHARGVVGAAGATLAGVWGRDPQKRDALAAEVGAPAFPSYDALLADVDAVTFAVPPQVQAELAMQAARAGRHLLLEKPVATDIAAAHALQRAGDEAGVATAVFVTARYTPERRQWAAELATGGPWRGAVALWLGAAFAPDSPFDTPWRHDKGALWDIGPHAVAAVEDALGPVEAVLAAAAGAGDLVHLVLRHATGATSTVTLTLGAAPEVAGTTVTVWGDAETRPMPRSAQSGAEAFAVAVGELIRAAGGGPAPTVDLAAGVHLTEVLAEAERLLASRP